MKKTISVREGKVHSPKMSYSKGGIKARTVRVRAEIFDHNEEVEVMEGDKIYAYTGKEFDPDKFINSIISAPKSDIWKWVSFVLALSLAVTLLMVRII